MDDNAGRPEIERQKSAVDADRRVCRPCGRRPAL